MLGLGLWPRPATRWWPDGAVYAADFTRDRYMINGLPVPRSAALGFSRNSPKLAQDSLGNWLSFGVNQPAITDRGLLLEPERQNTVINSNTLEWWNLLRASVTPNTGPGLEPGNGADLLVATETNVNGAFAGTNAQTVVPGAVHTFSIILRRAATDWIALVVSTNDNTHRKATWFNLATATVGSSQTVGTDIVLHAAGIETLPGDLLRPWVNVSTTTVTNPVFRIYLTDANNAFAVSPGTNVMMLQGQLELGTRYTSPIITVSSGISRYADEVALQLPEVGLNAHIAYLNGSETVLENCPSPLLLSTEEGPVITRIIAS